MNSMQSSLQWSLLLTIISQFFLLGLPLFLLFTFLHKYNPKIRFLLTGVFISIATVLKIFLLGSSSLGESAEIVLSISIFVFVEFLIRRSLLLFQNNINSIDIITIYLGYLITKLAALSVLNLISFIVSMHYQINGFSLPNLNSDITNSVLSSILVIITSIQAYLHVSINLFFLIFILYKTKKTKYSILWEFLIIPIHFIILFISAILSKNILANDLKIFDYILLIFQSMMFLYITYILFENLFTFLKKDTNESINNIQSNTLF